MFCKTNAWSTTTYNASGDIQSQSSYQSNVSTNGESPSSQFDFSAFNGNTLPSIDATYPDNAPVSGVEQAWINNQSDITPSTTWSDLSDDGDTTSATTYGSQNSLMESNPSAGSSIGTNPVTNVTPDPLVQGMQDYEDANTFDGDSNGSYDGSSSTIGLNNGMTVTNLPGATVTPFSSFNYQSQFPAQGGGDFGLGETTDESVNAINEAHRVDANNAQLYQSDQQLLASINAVQ